MREIRPYGSVPGVRRKPYPYRDTPYPLRSSALFCQQLRGRQMEPSGTVNGRSHFRVARGSHL
jgi:hypothetical protein